MLTVYFKMNGELKAVDIECDFDYSKEEFKLIKEAISAIDLKADGALLVEVN